MPSPTDQAAPEEVPSTQIPLNSGLSKDVEPSDGDFQRQEKEWVDKARSGDEDAFRCLFEHYFPKLYGTLFHIVHEADTAEDLTQQAMIQAWRRLDRFDGRSAFGTWLYRVAVNLALDHLRRKKNRKTESLEKTLEDTGAEPVGETEHPSEGMSRDELGRVLSDALSKLSEAHRTTFVLAEVQQLPYEEISKVMNCKRGTVMSRMHYARMHLQRLLKGHYGR